MKKGYIVKVFRRPTAEKAFEGVAKIISVYRGDYDPETKLHLCKVQFEITEAPVMRRVKSKHIVTTA